MMPFFAAFLVPAFQWLFKFFIFRYSAKTASVLVLVGILSVVTGVFYALITGLVSGLAYAIPDPWFRMYFYAIIPSNLTTCVSLIFASEVGAFIYRYQVRILLMASGL